MKTIKELLELRTKTKADKPAAIRHGQHRKKRLEKKWRKPKGIQNKMRLGRKGHRPAIQIGHGSPRLVKGLHKSGVENIVVRSVTDLKNLDPKKHGVTIGKIGIRKKLLLIKEIEKLGLVMLNVKDSKKYEEGVKKKLDEKKKTREQALEKRKKKKEKKPEKKESVEKKVLTEEDKIKKEKEEKDKILTKG